MLYSCSCCKKKFNKKSHYENHLNRKIKCTPNIEPIVVENNNNICENCNKVYSRKDSLNRHKIKCVNINQTCKKIVNKDGNVILGNNNKIIINQYNLCPFAKDGTDCLSTGDKVAIFSSTENPLEMIIVKVNLDPIKLDHHNVGITDLQSGYGIIFDGDKWITERINVIMEVLLNSKEKDLLKIYDEIKDFLSDNAYESIKDTINNLNNKLYPRNKIDAGSRKNLIAHLKKHFYNNRNLVIEAKKNNTANKYTTTQNNKFKNILKEGLSIDDIDKEIQLRKKYEPRINCLKELCFYLLKKSMIKNNIDKHNFELISFRINSITNDIDTLNTIINTLTKSSFFDQKISDILIEHKISELNKINNLLF